jgi:NADH-quinone oxidoreductase subunit L
MGDLIPVQYSYLIPLLPLLGAIATGFFGARWLKEHSHWPIWIGVGCSAILSICLLVGTIGIADEAPPVLYSSGHVDYHLPTVSYPQEWFSWIRAGDPNAAGSKKFFDAPAGFFFDPLTAVMLCVVTGVGLLICIFSKGYMLGEKGYFRFFAYLGLFIFMMSILVMGGNLIMLYLGWEGVGLCSYLLIGYYYEKPAAREAAKKAFLVNRVGDFGFGIGIMLCFLAFGTVNYFGQGAGTNTGLLELATHPSTAFQIQAMQWIPFLLMLGAFGKSAQFPLYVWLPDAMEGPTPVSALIHAATMVTAGVYMIVRCSTLFFGNAAAMTTIACIGAFTAILAASIALRQFDLKKVFAYSTISQLGYMFVGVAVLAPVTGVFHLVTHAFFKALLFLSAGVVMHAMAGELDMRKMSGLKRVMPVTRWCMLIGCLALAGFPPFSGFWSKDDILGAAFASNKILWAVLLFTSFLTAYYTFRLYFRVFEGPEVIPESAHVGHGHETEPSVMTVPLILLAFGAVLAGLLNLPFGDWNFLGRFLSHSPSLTFGMGVATQVGSSFNGEGFGFASAEAASPWVGLITGAIVSTLGIALAYWLHLRDRAMATTLAEYLAPLVDILDHKYWVDELYQNAIVEPMRKLGRLLGVFDHLIDGIINLLSWVPQVGGFFLRLTTQTGYLQRYAAAMILGLVVILLFLFHK